jgi:hypothetical protein
MSRTAASSLATHVKVRPGFLRATNIEHHDAKVGHYIPTGRALDVLGRLSRSVHGDAPGRAWSLTGPYGAGKSSFAVFLRVLLGPPGAVRDEADERLRTASQAAGDGVLRARDTAGATARGFLLATTTCQPESVTDSLLRGLDRGASEYWTGRKPKAVTEALTHARTARTPRAVADAASALSEHAPVLIVLDEFGKTLEHFARTAGSSEADLFVLQELAERPAGEHPVLLLTLQHLAFDDYVRGAAVAQRREWGKIAGRFEDVPFLETAEQSLRLVAGALETPTTTTKTVTTRRRAWARDAHEQLLKLGLEHRLPGGADTLQDCYPLHPVALLALPGLCAQLGQHGRTLFTFLASREPHTLGDFLDCTLVPGGSAPLPSLSLAEVFDFFAGPGRALSTAAGPRWVEIEARVQEAANLCEEDRACLKTVGLLNLLAESAGLRASADIAAYALSPADTTPAAEWRRRLEDLEGRGWLTYRGFADEYRLWQGSDVDLRTRIADAREQLRSTSAAGLLATLHAGRPLIAGKHTQRVGMLRYFTPGYADTTTRTLTPIGAADPADGAVIFYLGEPATLDALQLGEDDRPVVAATSTCAAAVQDAAVEAAAALAVLDQREVAADRVARRELQDRVAEARRHLTTTLDEAFRPDGPGVRYFRRTSSGWEPLTVQAGTGLSRLLSDVCDQAYDHSPEIRNEMLGRRELTSQGAKARRELLEAMVTRHQAEKLGISGYGPERAMYEALLRHTGLHAQQDDGTWAFSNPKPGDTLNQAWGTLAIATNSALDAPVSVDALYAKLKAPPIGLKDGPIPVILAAFLLHRADDVAVYEDGTYQPEITADLLERMLKTPQRFGVKAFDLAGPRGRVLTAILDATGLEPAARLRGRNTTVLRVAAPLLQIARGLPIFTKRTKKALSEDAERVRDVLLTARQPDTLLFEQLPAACGLPAIPAKNTAKAADQISTYADRLAAALQDLTQAFPATMHDCCLAIADELEIEEDELAELRVALRQRARELMGKVLEPDLRSFLLTAANTDFDDEAWLEALALAVSKAPPPSWTDDDRARFEVNLHNLAGVLKRVQALHFEALTRGGTDGFTAHRVTVTAPDGTENASVVWVDRHSEPYLNDLADQVLAQAEKRLGPIGRRALLAVIAGKTLPAALAEQTGTTLTAAEAHSA